MSGDRVVGWHCTECGADLLENTGEHREPGVLRWCSFRLIPRFVPIIASRRPAAELPDDDTPLRCELPHGSAFFMPFDRGPDGDGFEADRWAERQPNLGNGWCCFTGAIDVDEVDEDWRGEGDAVLFVAEE